MFLCFDIFDYLLEIVYQLLKFFGLLRKLVEDVFDLFFAFLVPRVILVIQVFELIQFFGEPVCDPVENQVLGFGLQGFDDFEEFFIAEHS